MALTIETCKTDKITAISVEARSSGGSNSIPLNWLLQIDYRFSQAVIVVYIERDLALCCSFLSSLITLLLCGRSLLFK